MIRLGLFLALIVATGPTRVAQHLTAQLTGGDGNRTLVNA